MMHNSMIHEPFMFVMQNHRHAEGGLIFVFGVKHLICSSVHAVIVIRKE